MVTTTLRKASISPSALLSARIFFTLGWFSHNGSYIWRFLFLGFATMICPPTRFWCNHTMYMLPEQVYRRKEFFQRNKSTIHPGGAFQAPPGCIVDLLFLLTAARGTGTLGDLSCRGCPALRSNSGGQGTARCGACSTPHYPDESEEHGPVDNPYNNQEDKICQIPQR